MLLLDLTSSSILSNYGLMMLSEDFDGVFMKNGLPNKQKN